MSWIAVLLAAFKIRGRLSSGANPRFGGRLGSACFSFIRSRRWLIGSLVVTGLLVAFLLSVHPANRGPLVFPEDPDIALDDVKTFDAPPTSGETHVDPGKKAERGAALAASKSADEASLFAFDAPPSGNNAAAQERLTRRLDAVRSHRERGAWLTGTIESVPASAAGTPQRAPHRLAQEPGHSRFQ